MSKIPLIIKREYVTRVKKKSFIIMTILGPLLMAGVLVGFVYMAAKNGNTLSKIKVIDETEGQIFKNKLKSSASVMFVPDSIPYTVAKKTFDSKEYYGILYIPFGIFSAPDSFELYSDKNVNLVVVSYVEEVLQKEFENYNLTGAGIDPKVLKEVKDKKRFLKELNSSGGEEKTSSAEATAMIGFGGGLIIYMFIFIYGAQVMRGVMEEKTSRIVEVIISSVKPFQLMMGKIIGISLVALTQLSLWVILTYIISTVVLTGVMGIDKSAMQQVSKPPIQQNYSGEVSKEQTNDAAKEFFKNMSAYNIPKILFSFIFYFIGGYLLYASLFAAIGAAVDSETDVQQFMLPITIPLILAYIAAVFVMQNPDSPMGFWFSIIPFTSPIVMMVRMPFDPPVFDIVLSMMLLVLGFLGTTWLAGKIYRTGILMYGKKVTYKEIGKWLFYK